MGVVGCDAAVGSTGLAHVRRVLSLLIEPEDPVPLQLRLALSLLQVLPALSNLVCDTDPVLNNRR